MNDDLVSLISLSKDILVERYHFHFIQQGSLYEMNKTKKNNNKIHVDLHLFNLMENESTIFIINISDRSASAEGAAEGLTKNSIFRPM